MTYQFKESSVVIGSPFGGIIYILADCERPEKRIQVELKFVNVTRYPYFSSAAPSKWELVKNLEVPWGEFETRYCCFTLPKNELMQIKQLVSTADFLDKLFGRVIGFLGVKTPPKIYRFVFDVDLVSEKAIAKYPCYLPVEMIPYILLSREGSPEFLLICRLLAGQALAPLNFGQENNTAICYLAAVHAFVEVFPGFACGDYALDVAPRVLRKLEKIYKSFDRALFPGVFSKLRSTWSSKVTPDTIWSSFVTLLGHATSQDFSKELNLEAPSVKEGEKSGQADTLRLTGFRLDDDDSSWTKKS
jgi:hypothetical protein